ncbi:MAG TPA: ABC transporter permease [Longimicrobiaceae bacterium]|nr:ABC transporter permease [Longimicrobiaceae bacterium]
MDTLLQDIRYAARTLLRTPGFAVAAILTLALGIGVNTAVFSLANAFLLRPVDARDPGSMARVYQNRWSPLSWQAFDHVRQHSRTFAGIFAERNAVLALNTPQGNEKVQAELVSGDFFTTLGTSAAHGRLLTRADDAAPGANPVVVLSHRWWRSRFAGDPAVVGRTLSLNGRPYTVVGVVREGFGGARGPGFSPYVWLPMAEMEPLTGVRREEAGSVYVTGRLRPGVDVRQADADAGVMAAALTRLDPAQGEPLRLRVERARGVQAELRGRVTGLVGGLMVVTLLVLLIACTNVANLLLARATARRREIGIRLAIGASRGRLVRQLLTESLLLSLAGGVLAVLATTWLVSVATSLIPADAAVDIDVSPDLRVLLFALGVAVFAGVVFGLAPALRASAPDLVTSLKEGSGAARRSRLRSTLVGAQVALCMVLLACAGLFLRSLGNARRIDPGFDPAPILNLPIDLRLGRYDEQTGAEYYRRLIQTVREVPGVQSASLQRVMPLQGDNMETRFVLQGEGDDAARRSTNLNVIAPDFFRTLAIPVLRGRELADADGVDAPAVAVVNETFVRRNFADGQGVGKQVSMEGPQGPWATIVGVVRDAKYVTLGEDPRAMLYLPLAQSYGDEMVLHVRTAGDPAALARPVAAAAQALDPALPLAEPGTMRDQLRVALLPARIGAWVLGAFGTLALLLAAVGIYGVISYAVSQRTREIGIRAALGAGRAAIVRLVLADSFRVVAVGLAVGLALALLAGRAASTWLYGVSPADPAVLLGTPLVLAAVALLASWVPARRAARADPMLALRAE